jgi:hypothetical protein
LSGIGWYLAALVLDISKGALVLGLAVQIFEITGWPLVTLSGKIDALMVLGDSA